METNDLRKIWQSGVDQDIKPYSDKELTELVVKTARKSMKRIYPTGVFLLFVIAVVVSLIINLTVRNTTAEMRVLYLGALLILVVSLTLWLQSFFTMRKYEADMTIKNWLEYRIKEVEKTVKFNTKYDLLIYAVAILIGLGYYYFFVRFNNIYLNPWVTGAVPVGIVIYTLLVRKFLNKNYKKTLQELRELYKQFEE